MASRIVGLDALRFLCALCVVQGHLRIGETLVFERMERPGHLVRTLRMLYNQGLPVPTGPNAVIVFFVISGFCIHFPYRHGRRVQARQFLVRRYIRIGLPALVAAVLLYISGFHSLQDSVLWSILCECIYYSLYPLLLRIKERVGWRALIVGSFVACYAVLIAHTGDGPYNGDFTSLGIGRTWILGLPCWLLGCLLAETHTRFSTFGRGGQWLLRLAIVTAACVATTLRFYQGIGYYWTQPLLGLLIYNWLGTEVSYAAARSPWRWLERCGGWSYSIYLYHAPLAIGVATLLGQTFGVPATTLVKLAAALAGSYLLYRLVERPAHLLAQRFATRRGNPPQWVGSSTGSSTQGVPGAGPGTPSAASGAADAVDW